MQVIRFLLRAVLFLAFSAVIYLLVLAIVPRPFRYNVVRNLKVPIGGYGHLYTRLKEVSEHGPVDILVLGSSHAYRGFDPRIFAKHGLRLFNLGSSNQTPLQSEVLLQRHLDHLKPKLAIIEVLPATLASNGLESTLDLLANSPVDRGATTIALGTLHIKAVNAAAHAWLKQLIAGPPSTVEPLRKNLDMYIPGGYVEQDAITPLEDPVVVVEAKEPRTDQLQALQRSVALLEEKGITVVLVRTPVTAHYRQRHKEAHGFEALMRSVATYVDLNKSPDLVDPNLFYDGHHLDQPGVERTNAVFIDLLAKSGLLPEVRDSLR